MRALAIVVVVLTVSACGGGNSPAAPTPVTVVVAPCESNRTGTVTFHNAGRRTADILWNNARMATLTPGQTSGEFTVVAGGAQYVMDTIVTNTSFRPCQILVATPLQCRLNPYSTCSF